MDQDRTPILEALQAFEKKEKYAFHVPGHKSGAVLPKRGSTFFKAIMSVDTTELGGLDDLYEPTGVIKEGQALLTDFYQTKQSFFLVNGSTVGNLAMILTSCQPGDLVLVQRNAHKSIFHALKLSGVQAVFLTPETDPLTQVAVGLSLETVHEAVARYPNAKALVLTYPNYYGQTSPIADLIGEAKKAGLSILVDEAHGPHFKWGDPFPRSSLECGADLVVHSAHKMLPALTMGAYLHINQGPDTPSEEAVLQTLKILQTSSPSYPIMASLDLARSFLATWPKEKMSSLLIKIDHFKKGLEKLGFIVFDSGPRSADPLKVVLRRPGYTGFMLKEHFESVGLFPELADPLNLLLVLGLDEQFPINDILKVLGEMKWEKREPQPIMTSGAVMERINQDPIPYYRYQSGTLIKKGLKQAVGDRAGEAIMPYPPGIPILVEGERITSQHLKTIEIWKKAGAAIQGIVEDRGVLYLKVISSTK